MQFDPNCRYTETHEWIRVEENEALVGITMHAQEQLSNVVFVELSEVGDKFQQGDVLAVVESVKAASECYAPVSGEVISINEELLEAPEWVNEEPYEHGWFVRVALDDPGEVDQLMDAQQYEAYLARLSEE
ncbi:MAG: glycine cleavage system protein GcvH [Chloroflexota bacterium]|nr:glycine cleavage system protein GcvH [Chloroflexota bacterium]